jgi:hypothetical protein
MPLAWKRYAYFCPAGPGGWAYRVEGGGGGDRAEAGGVDDVLAGLVRVLGGEVERDCCANARDQPTEQGALELLVADEKGLGAEHHEREDEQNRDPAANQPRLAIVGPPAAEPDATTGNDQPGEERSTSDNPQSNERLVCVPGWCRRADSCALDGGDVCHVLPLLSLSVPVPRKWPG